MCVVTTGHPRRKGEESAGRLCACSCVGCMRAGTCIYVCHHACGDQRTTLGVPPQTPTCFFEVGSLTVLELIK